MRVRDRIALIVILALIWAACAVGIAAFTHNQNTMHGGMVSCSTPERC
jgi:uncharacterized membrane protein